MELLIVFVKVTNRKRKKGKNVPHRTNSRLSVAVNVILNLSNHSYGYRPNWTPLSPVTITNNLSCNLSLKILFSTNETYTFVHVLHENE